MTKQQREVSRKLSSIGCTSEYDENQKRLCIRHNGEYICSLGNNGAYYLPPDVRLSDVRLSDEQEDVYRNIEKLIDITKEYITAYDNAKPFDIEGISDYRKLAEFNDVVFGAKDCGDFGFQFSSWFKTYDGTGVTLGNYSFDYESSKQNFAVRSGLVARQMLFSNEQLENMYRCLSFTQSENGDLTFNQEKSISSLMNQIENIIPYVKDNPDYQYTPSEDGSIILN